MSAAIRSRAELARTPRTPEQLASDADTHRPHQRTFWGKVYDVAPVVLAFQWGDGKQALEVTPMNARPHFFVAYIDSSWMDLDLDDDDFREHVALDIIDALVEEHGECLGDEACADGCECSFPRVDWGIGYAWCLASFRGDA